jgi:hypothetical protein
MNSFWVSPLGLIAVVLAVIRLVDHLCTLWRARPAGQLNLRRPALLAAATSLSSTIYAHSIGSDLYLLSAALINAGTALMNVLLPASMAGQLPVLAPADMASGDTAEGA